MIKNINFPKLDILNFYKMYIEIHSPFVPVQVLRPREKELLALIMSYNYKYRHLDTYDRSKIIFNADTKKTILKELDCNIGILNNNLSILRRHEFIDENNILNPKWDIIPDAKNSIVFNLDLENNGS